MNLQEYIKEFNRIDKPRNFPYKLRTEEYITYNNLWKTEELYIRLIVGYTTNLNDIVELFHVEDSIQIDKTNYKSKLEMKIIDVFEKIKFQDTLRNLF